MLDHTGKVRVRYEDTLRAVGNYLDDHSFTQIVLVETPEGFLIKGQIAAGSSGSNALQTYPETYLFTHQDIDTVVETAYRRRRR
jgi:hypothetical protein